MDLATLKTMLADELSDLCHDEHPFLQSLPKRASVAQIRQAVAAQTHEGHDHDMSGSMAESSRIVLAGDAEEAQFCMAMAGGHHDDDHDHAAHH